jgi:hypothetical protein
MGSAEFVVTGSLFAALAFGYIAGVALFYSESVPTRVGGIFLAASTIASLIGLGTLGWHIAWLTAVSFVVVTVAFVYRHRPRWMPHRSPSAVDTSTERVSWAANYRGLQPNAPKDTRADLQAR